MSAAAKAYFAKHNVPADSLPLREVEHLLQCEFCAHTFPLWAFHNGDLTEWCQLTETERHGVVAQLQKHHQAFLRKYVKTKTPSGYQLYLTDHSRHTPGNQVMERTRQLAASWQQLSPPEKQVYQERADQLAQTYQQTIQSWSKPMQKELREMKEQRKGVSEKRPTSAFVMYLSDRWKEQKGLRSDYRQFQHEMAEQWKIDPRKHQYQDLADRQQQAFQMRRGKVKMNGLESDEEDGNIS